MTIDSYLKLTRDKFTYAEEQMKPMFENMAKQLGLKVVCIAIKSSKARIEFIELDGCFYIIWDLNYWKVFERYLCHRRKLDAKDMDEERSKRILWEMALNFFDFFREYFPPRGNASYKFARACWVHGYVEPEDYDYSDTVLNETLFICKMYTFVHEIYHLYFGLNAKVRKNVEENIRYALKKCEEQVYKEAVSWREHFHTYHTQEEVEEALRQLIWGEAPIYDELLSDTAAFYQTCYIYFTGSGKDAESDWGMFVPKVRNSIFEIRSYSLLLKTLIQIVSDLENRADASTETIIKEHYEHSRRILLREFAMKFIEIDQLRLLLSTLNLEQVLAAYNLDIVPPFRKSYYEFVLPYFEKFANKVMIPILYRV